MGILNPGLKVCEDKHDFQCCLSKLSVSGMQTLVSINRYYESKDFWRRTREGGILYIWLLGHPKLLKANICSWISHSLNLFVLYLETVSTE